MIRQDRLFSTSIKLAAVAAALAVAACISPHSVQQVNTGNPTVTYEYRGDQELLRAQQNAISYCGQYGATPRTLSTTRIQGTDLSNVVFECEPNTTSSPPNQPGDDSTFSYNYRTDQELLDASWSAQARCRDIGLQPVVVDSRMNLNGTRTVTFQCVRA